MLLCVVTGRLSEETIPEVTVPFKPSGEPNAITGSPIAILVESPVGIIGRLPVATRSTARSYEISRPTRVAGMIVPSFRVIVIAVELFAAAISIT